MNLLITGANRKLCKDVSKLAEKAGFIICKRTKAPLQLYSDKECNCAVRRENSVFTAPLSPKIGLELLSQISKRRIKIIFVDTETKGYNSSIARYQVKKNPTYVQLTIKKSLLKSNPDAIVDIIKQRFVQEQ